MVAETTENQKGSEEKNRGLWGGIKHKFAVLNSGTKDAAGALMANLIGLPLSAVNESPRLFGYKSISNMTTGKEWSPVEEIRAWHDRAQKKADMIQYGEEIKPETVGEHALHFVGGALTSVAMPPVSAGVTAAAGGQALVKGAPLLTPQFMEKTTENLVGAGAKLAQVAGKGAAWAAVHPVKTVKGVAGLTTTGAIADMTLNGGRMTDFTLRHTLPEEGPARTVTDTLGVTTPDPVAPGKAQPGLLGKAFKAITGGDMAPETEDMIGKSLGIAGSGMLLSWMMPSAIGDFIKLVAIGCAALFILNKTGVLSNVFNNSAVADDAGRKQAPEVKRAPSFTPAVPAAAPA